MFKLCKALKETGAVKTIVYMLLGFVSFQILFTFLGIQHITEVIVCLACFIGYYYMLVKQLHHQANRAWDKLQMQNLESKPVSEFDAKWTAYHEAGHALVARLESSNLKIKEITIVPNKIRGAAGAVMTAQINQTCTASNMISSIKVDLAGMIAQDIAFNEHSTGCVADLKKAKGKVFHMLEDLNMGKRMIYADKKELDTEAEQILQDQKAETRKLLTDNWNIIVDLKNELMLKKDMSEEEINTFFQKYGI